MTDDSTVASSVEGEPMEGGAVSGQCTRPEQPQQRLTLLPLVAFCVAISLAASMTTLYIYDLWYAQKIVAVDLKGYIAQQRDNYLAGKLNDDELKRSFDHLERIITTIPRNRVVIMGDAVVRNAETIKP